MSEPLISVVLPVFNGASTIALTLESLLHQTVPGLEIFVIDDGSTDSTRAIANRFQGSQRGHHIHVESFPNSGVSVSRNRGLARAKGKYVAFIDADDLWVPRKLERQLAALQSDQAAGLAYSFTAWIDETGKPVPGGLARPLYGDVYQELLLQDFIGSGSNPLVKRECFDDVGGFDPDLHPAEDWDMWLRLAVRYPFACVPERDVLYRQLPMSASSKVSVMARQSLRIIERECGVRSHRLPPGFRNKVFASRYEYLMFTCLKRPLSRTKAWDGLGFLLQMLRYDRTFLLRGKILAVTLVKIGLGIVCPGILARNSPQRFRPTPEQ
jgi:glycosyltransferase involved in cell wall biosynthesis